jgi:hypothetical protein
MKKSQRIATPAGEPPLIALAIAGICCFPRRKASPHRHRHTARGYFAAERARKRIDFSPSLSGGRRRAA